MLLEPILSVFILIILMVIMLIVYVKLRIFLVILVIFLLSLIIGITSIMDYSLPFSPYLQILFILFQSVIFIITSIGVFTYGKER